ncbi:MAG: alkaline phosphatase [Phycisphaeraceae bacterium]|nr:MAG: alkaline phosphatase [Phycisphaeraceae bacterium]
MPEHAMPSRRDVLAAGVGLLAAGGLARAQSTPTGPSTPTAAPKGKAKNVIFMVADGMSMGTFTLADTAITRRTGRGSAWARLWDDPRARRSMMATRSLDSLVTDSAAAGSTWGCGRRINNGEINWHDGEEFEPILVSAHNAGKATGLVTTTRVTHATPASFIANVPDRNMEDEIARQILDRRVDVVLGGGAKYVTPELLAEHPDIRAVRTAEELFTSGKHEGRLVGVFSKGHMSYELDREAIEPHIKDMAMFAIDRLSQHPGGFVMQIEGGRVDHGGHANDFPASLHDMMAFDLTVGAVTQWASRRDDTLVIITTDHGNGNPDLTVYGERSLKGFETLLGAGHTLTWITERVQQGERDAWPTRLHDMIAEHAGVELSEDEVDWAMRPLRGDRVNGFDEANLFVCALGAVMANHFGVAYISHNHTSEHVEATACGPGAETLPTRIDNTFLHGLMTQALGLPVG